MTARLPKFRRLYSHDGPFVRSHLEPVIVAGPETLAEFNAWFWAKFAGLKKRACWEWPGCKSGGYGVFTWRRNKMSAHRIAYELAKGPITDGLLVCHRCDNPACCNPAHLEKGSTADNVWDAVQKGRHVGARGVRAHNAQLCDFRARLIISSALPVEELAELFGVSKYIVWAIRAGQTWRHVDADLYPPHWPNTPEEIAAERAAYRGRLRAAAARRWAEARARRASKVAAKATPPGATVESHEAFWQRAGARILAGGAP